jgi:hypothetical protein
MPDLDYAYVNRAAVHGPFGLPSCVPGGPGANLPGIPSPFQPAWPALYHAQLVFGVYVGPPWDQPELEWRTRSLDLSTNPPPGIGPGIMSPSPIVEQMDATEKSQLSYHAGTAAGLTFALTSLNPGPVGAVYFAFHLTRFQHNGGAFTFAPGVHLRPDLVLVSISMPAIVNHIVIWECKGHAIPAGQAPLGPALQQSAAVVNVTALPGVPPVVLPAPMGPAAYVASQVDVTGVPRRYRLQVTDPSGPPPTAIEIPEDPMSNFFRAYYAPFAQILHSNPRREQRNYDGTIFETLEIGPKRRFGMEASLYRAYVAQSATFAGDVARAIGAGFSNAAPDSVFVGPTGLSFELEKGWAEA